MSEYIFKFELLKNCFFCDKMIDGVVPFNYIYKNKKNIFFDPFFMLFYIKKDVKCVEIVY